MTDNQEITVTELEQGLHSGFWRLIRARLEMLRRKHVQECCREGVDERRADHLRGSLDMLDLILGTETRSSLPNVMLSEFTEGKKR